MATTAFRGGTSGGTGSAFFNVASYIYDGISYPTGNLNLAGSRPVAINSVSPEYATNLSAATVSSDGLVRLYTNSGMTFKRNQGAGGVVTLAYNGSTWSGALTGQFAWSTVPTKPASLSASRTARDVDITAGSSSSDGGQSITGYKVQRSWSADGSTGWSAWEDEQTLVGLAYTYDDLTPGRYYKFRTYAQNANGSSEARESSVLFVPAGGKRKVSGAFQSTTIARRRASGIMVDLTIAKRRAAGTWVDLS